VRSGGRESVRAGLRVAAALPWRRAAVHIAADATRALLPFRTQPLRAPAPHGDGVIVPLLVVLAAAIAFGIWRRFTAIQWIWLGFGLAIGMVILWLLLVVLVVGPEMRRMAPFR
jgi:hypothetical protein